MWHKWPNMSHTYWRLFLQVAWLLSTYVCSLAQVPEKSLQKTILACVCVTNNYHAMNDDDDDDDDSNCFLFIFSLYCWNWRMTYLFLIQNIFVYVHFLYPRMCVCAWLSEWVTDFALIWQSVSSVSKSGSHGCQIFPRITKKWVIFTCNMVRRYIKLQI